MRARRRPVQSCRVGSRQRVDSTRGNPTSSSRCVSILLSHCWQPANPLSHLPSQTSRRSLSRPQRLEARVIVNSFIRDQRKLGPKAFYGIQRLLATETGDDNRNRDKIERLRGSFRVGDGGARANKANVLILMDCLWRSVRGSTCKQGSRECLSSSNVVFSRSFAKWNAPLGQIDGCGCR